VISPAVGVPNAVGGGGSRCTPAFARTTAMYGQEYGAGDQHPAKHSVCGDGSDEAERAQQHGEHVARLPAADVGAARRAGRGDVHWRASLLHTSNGTSSTTGVRPDLM
jgi:hypothetical protein